MNNLQFGIPSFDALFGRGRPRADEPSYDYGSFGIRVPQESGVTSLCFIGPEGTGKSVFGLHLASQYLADACLTHSYTDLGIDRIWCPRVLYVSTDLKHRVAKEMWDHFGLDRPNARVFPHYSGYRFRHEYASRLVELEDMNPSNVSPAVFAGNPDPLHATVYFIDLVSHTMGDDWIFINRMLALLRRPVGPCAPHLVIIDAVEGFETLVGERDAFGEITSRRARVTQIMRTAADKCNVCFIIEEPKAEDRFPEQFVTDVVVRLRAGSFKGYTRRTVEILKTRGQSHVRGEHPFVIRSGNGSTTGLQENADDVQTPNSYVHVFHSLHYLSREEMKARGPANPPASPLRVAAFGVTYLDEMLARLRSSTAWGLDDQGLPAQTTTALLGDIATQKTSLATAFLARTFRPYIFGLTSLIRELTSASGGDSVIRTALTARLCAPFVIAGLKAPQIESAVDAMVRSIRADAPEQFLDQLNKCYSSCPAATMDSAPPWHRGGSNDSIAQLAAWLAEALPAAGAVVLITTSNQHRDGLIAEFWPWLENSISKALRDWPRGRHPLRKGFQEHVSAALARHLIQRTICRRLELHDLASPILMQIIQWSVGRAQERVFLSQTVRDDVDHLPYRRTERFKRSWNVRVVIDDLSTLKDTYPDIGSDPIFLPFLLSVLELEGVTALIIDSQNGRPGAPVVDAFDREVRALVPHKLLTWRVPFYGSIRDAITVLPPFPSGLRSVIREVRWESKKDGANVLVVDPEMELYSGLERGEPKSVPLEVRLYAESEVAERYFQEENVTLSRLFTPVSSGNVIVTMKSGEYDSLQDFCNLQSDTLLNHTLVFQVDEFWAINRTTATNVSMFPRGPVARREGALYPLGPYLTEQTSIYDPPSPEVPDRIADPFGVFQGAPSIPPREHYGNRWERRHYFFRSAQTIPGLLDPNEIAHLDRIPFTWDFGFLLCPKTMWDLARDLDVGYGGLTVGEVWSKSPSVLIPGPQEPIKWRAFLGACVTVARYHATRASGPIKAFDVSTLAPESFSCLLLELWASEVLSTLTPLQRRKVIRQLKDVDASRDTDQGLIEWLKMEEFVFALYKVWLLLIDALPLSELVDRQTIPTLKSRAADGNSVATRHWYKTACGSQLCPVTNELAIPVRLPGHFSTRGDWFLAVAGGSRSERLGRRILDLLSSRRANFRRMEVGIGLPTRDISSAGKFSQLPTALKKMGDQGQISAITYGELIGSDYIHDCDFHWLWRSQLRGYFRHCRLFHKWVAQMIVMWIDLRNRLGKEWMSGFELYDQFEQLSYKDAAQALARLDSWNAYYNMSLLLAEQVQIASSNTARRRADVS